MILNLVYGTETMAEKWLRSFEGYLVKWYASKKGKKETKVCEKKWPKKYRNLPNLKIFSHILVSILTFLDAYYFTK